MGKSAATFWGSSKVWWIAAAMGLCLIVGLAGGLGYYFSNKDNYAQIMAGGGGGGGGPGDNLPPDIRFTTNLTITPDPRYIRSFWGIDFTPLKAQSPWCGLTQDDIINDLKILYQLTPRIRLYGMDCHQADYVLNGLKQLKVNMGVILTIWVDNNATTYQRQYETFFRLVNDYGWDNIIGVSVGNEAVFRKEIEFNDLVARIKDVRDKVTALGHPEIPVYTTEIELLSQIVAYEDVLLDNVHPFFGKVKAEEAAAWTWQYFDDVDISLAAQHGRKALISEIGWPTAPANESQGGAVPSLPNLQIILNDFVCEANSRGVPYFWFEWTDSPWKIFSDSTEFVEAYWGIFTKDKTIKPGLTIPNCPLQPFTPGDVTIPQPARITSRVTFTTQAATTTTGRTTTAATGAATTTDDDTTALYPTTTSNPFGLQTSTGTSGLSPTTTIEDE